MEPKTYRNKWMEFTTGWSGISLMLCLAGYFDNRVEIKIYPGWGKLFINLPIRTKYNECEPPRYGFYYFANALWFCWGKKVKPFYLPWHMEWVRTSVLRSDGNWEHDRKGSGRKDLWDEKKWDGIFWQETYPYTYTYENGEVQQLQATLKVNEREWRPRWLQWTNLFARARKTIEVEFSDGVGSRRGTWKGGVLGCNYEMLKGESPLESLRRMERDRRFD